MDLRFDASDFDALARDLTAAAAADLLGQVESSVKAEAGNVKTAMRADMAASTHFGQVAHVIDYDVDRFTEHVRAEVGPRTAGKTVGDLAHIAYFGGSDGRGRAKGGGTVPDPEIHLDAAADSLEGYVGKILDGLL